MASIRHNLEVHVSRAQTAIQILNVKHWPIGAKLGIFFTLPLVVSLSFLGWWQQRSFAELIQTQTEAFGQTLVLQVSESAAELVLAEDFLALEVMLSGILRQSPIQYAAVYSYEDQLLVESSAENTIGPVQIEPSLTRFSAPIEYQEVRVGRLVIDIDVSMLSQAMQRSKSRFFNTHYWVLLIALVITLFLAKYFTKPLRWLRESTTQIAEGEWPELIQYGAKDELGDLIQSFNKMTTELREKEKIKQTFYKFVSQPVADNLLSEDLKQSEAIYNYSRSTVLFIDLVGFTGLCERSAPRDVALLLNDYYQIIYYASHKFGGHVDKFIGDGAMIVFGVLKEDASHTQHGVLCAALMRKLVDDLNAERKIRDLDVLGVRLGVHTGEVLAGSLGADERAQYTVVGDVVNMASRLCDASEPDEILVGDVCINEPGVEGMLAFKGPRYVSIKGRSDPLAVFSVSGLKAPAAALIKHYVQGWKYDASGDLIEDDW